MTMKKTVITIAAAGMLSASSAFATIATSSTADWGGVTTDATLLSLADHIDTEGNFYSKPDFSTRSAGTIAAFQTSPADLISAADESQFLNIFYLGSRAGNTHTIGFDLFEVDGGGTNFLGDVALNPNFLGSDETKFGSVFSMTIEDILDLAGMGPLLNGGSEGFLIDLWISNTGDPYYGVGQFETKLSLSDGRAIDYTTFLEDVGDLGPFDADNPVPWGNLIDVNLTNLYGFEDILESGNGGIADEDYGDVFLAASVADRPISEVPEPSTYGLIGAIALAGLIIRRRMLIKKSAEA